MNGKSLSEQEILNVISIEYSLSQKRSQNEAFEAKFNFGKCRICSSEATGIHYGVCSCEGCKVIDDNFKILQKHLKLIIRAFLNAVWSDTKVTYVKITKIVLFIQEIPENANIADGWLVSIRECLYPKSE